MFGKGLFGGLFDLDNNGEMSPEELALEMLLFDELTRDDEEDDEDIDDYDNYYNDLDDDI